MWVVLDRGQEKAWCCIVFAPPTCSSDLRPTRGISPRVQGLGQTPHAVQGGICQPQHCHFFQAVFLEPIHLIITLVLGLLAKIK